MKKERGEEKRELRREVLARRDSVSPQDRRRMSRGIFSRILALPEYETARTTLAYYSFGSEPQTEVFLKAVIKDGKRLVLPRIEREANALVLHEVKDPASELVAGVWGIMEPGEGLSKVPVEEVDFVLTPGIAFDEFGGRLGYGGGFYDLMLSGPAVRRPALVAAAFASQVVSRVPVAAHDVPVDAVVTEKAIIRRA